MVALVLSEHVGNFLVRVDQVHNQLHIAWHSCWPEDGLALLGEVVDEVVQVFAFVDAEEGFILFVLGVEVIVPEGSEKVALLIGGKGVHKDLIHLQDNSELALVLGQLGR